MDFLIVNGKVTAAAEVVFDGWRSSGLQIIRQSVWFGYGGIPLLNENINQLQMQTRKLGYELPAWFNNRRELFRVCKRMLNKSKNFRSGLLHFRLFLSSESIGSIVLTEPREIFDFPLSKNGMLVSISPYNLMSDNKLTAHSTYHELHWQYCRAALKGTTFHSSIIRNDKGFVMETIGANLFAVKDGVLTTPALETGCFSGILRQTVLELAKKMDYRMIESNEISTDLLLNSDELFTVSEARGIEWILGLDNKRFVRDFSKELHLELNRFLQTKAEN